MSILLPEVIKGMQDCLSQNFCVTGRIPPKPNFADYYKGTYRSLYANLVGPIPECYKNTAYGTKYYPHDLGLEYAPVPKGGLILMPIRGFVEATVSAQVIREPDPKYNMYRDNMLLCINPEDWNKIKDIESETHSYLNLLKILQPICPLYLSRAGDFTETKPYKR